MRNVVPGDIKMKKHSPIILQFCHTQQIFISLFHLWYRYQQWQGPYYSYIEVKFFFFWSNSDMQNLRQKWFLAKVIPDFIDT